MKRRFATLCVAILTLTTLSGCIGEASLPMESESPDDPASPNEASLFDECVEHDGMERCWLTHIPSTYGAMNPPPLLINMHGFGGTNSDFYNYSRFDVLAETEGFVTLYPQGVEDSWNAGWCCGEAKDVGIDDVDFILTMIETVSDNISFGATRIYSSGHSNGCAMTHKLANEASDVFAAAGCMALYLLEEPHPSYSPISLIEVHGVVDAIIPYGTSYSSSLYFDGSLDGEEGAIQNIMDWAAMNECEDSGGTPKMFEMYADYSIMGYDACEMGTEVHLVTLNYANHWPYPDIDFDNPTNVDTVQIVWEFMSRFSKSADDTTA